MRAPGGRITRAVEDCLIEHGPQRQAEICARTGLKQAQVNAVLSNRRERYRITAWELCGDGERGDRWRAVWAYGAGPDAERPPAPPLYADVRPGVQPRRALPASRDGLPRVGSIWELGAALTAKR